jgi:POT family proton-dependent oligopeptide transporter
VLGVYSQIGWIAIAVGIGVLLISPLIKKLMHLDTLRDDDSAAATPSDEAYPIAARPAE